MPDLSMLDGVNAQKIERSLLKDQVADLLRASIIKGDIQQGAKVVERELAEVLGVSRVPVRDALMQLETEGLVVSRLSGRYVIELTERDVKELYQIRVVLEKLAVKLVIERATPQQLQRLNEKLDEMRLAVEQQHTRTYVHGDVEIHRLIWEFSGNYHLQRIFHSMIGPIFIFASSHARVYDWGVTLSLHEDLIKAIVDKDEEVAFEAVERHMADALQRSLNLLARESQAKLKGGV
jgi:GntR family transcriptional regulator of gluconate operon